MSDKVVHLPIPQAFGLKQLMNAKKGLQLSRNAVRRLQEELALLASEVARLRRIEDVASRFVGSQGIVQQAMAMCDPARYERATGKVVSDQHTYAIEAHQALAFAQKSMLNCNIDLVKVLKMDAPSPQAFAGKTPPQPTQETESHGSESG